MNGLNLLRRSKSKEKYKYVHKIKIASNLYIIKK